MGEFLEQAIRLVVVQQERFYFGQQVWSSPHSRRTNRVRSSGRISSVAARISFTRSQAYGMPAYFPRSSRASQAFATFQLRFTVAGEIFRTSAVSSMSRPPK